jgi:Ni/Co efflux regulator RcnB
MNMLSKITKALVATAMLATAIAASPALAQTQDRTQGQASGTYHGYPTSEWTRPDSW